MYDRAPREFVKPVGSTAVNVGPGSYDADLPTKARFKAGTEYFVIYLYMYINLNYLLAEYFLYLKDY